MTLKLEISNSLGVARRDICDDKTMLLQGLTNGSRLVRVFVGNLFATVNTVKFDDRSRGETKEDCCD